MISKEKQLQYKQELDKYTDMALITELYNRKVEEMTQLVAEGEN